MNKERKKLIWMKQEFIKECKRMLEMIEQQELKIIAAEEKQNK